jgi:DNA polymerase II
LNTVEQGFLLTRQSQDINRQTVITYWLSTNNGPVKLVITGEKPTFFTEAANEPAIRQALQALITKVSFKDLALKTFAQEPVLGLYFHTQRDAFDAQALLNKARIPFYEADLRLSDRFLMERFVYGAMEFTGQLTDQHTYHEYHAVKIRPSNYIPQLNVISLDIECSFSGELYSIGLYSNNEKQPYQKVLMIGETQSGPDWISWVPDEKALLAALVTTINDVDPDIIIGWNIINFDCRLLLQRAEKHGMQLLLGRDHSAATWRNSRNDTQQGFITIAGRMVIDGIDGLKTATYSFPSFSLEYVAQTLLGRGKKIDNTENRVDEITHNFLHDKEKLAIYNLEDCVLVWDIFKHTRLLDFLVFRSQLTGLELDKQGGSVAAFTNLYLPHLHRAGYIAPNLPADGGLASPGGYVMNSRPGLYHNVVVLDFKSLYPSIIRTFKIDPLGLIEGLLHPEAAIEGFKGALFSRDKHFLPDIITQLWQERDEAKKNKDDARSQAIKIIMNSFYGVLGSGGCRFYDTRLASSITMRGHEILQQTADWIEQMGYEVIYGDTDSIFILLPAVSTLDECHNIAVALQDEINNNWHYKIRVEHQMDCYLEIEFDNHYSRFLMPTIRGSEMGSKKRYAGLIQHKTGDHITEEIVFKGLESVRTDWTDLAKIFQRELFDCVFHDKDPSAFIENIIKETRTGLRDEQLVYRKRLRQPLHLYVKNVPPHVRAARIADECNRLNNQPLQYQNKGWINYVITQQGPEPLEYQMHALDYEHYIDKQLRPVAEAILPLIGLSFNSFVLPQMGLFQ